VLHLNFNLFVMSLQYVIMLISFYNIINLHLRNYNNNNKILLSDTSLLIIVERETSDIDIR